MTILWALWLLAAPVAGAEIDPQLAELIASSPRSSDLPEADAVYLRDEKTVEADERGRVAITLRQTVKVLREPGRRHATVPLPWTRRSQSITVTAARTVQADGRVFPVGQDALEQLYAGRYAETFPVIRHWRLRFPFVDPGDIVDYQVTIADTEPSMPEGFSDRFLMQAIDPILDCVYTVRSPAGMTVRSWVNGRLEPPQVRREGERNVTTWRARDVPALADEPQAPSYETLATWVMVSAVPSWDAVAARYREVARPKYVAHTALRRQVAELLRDEPDPARALYEYVSRTIRYGRGPFELGQPGIEPRPAYETFDHPEGDCKDQATLLITMLREAGLTAWPALVRRTTDGPVVRDLATLRWFDHVIVAVSTGRGRYRWLDSTYEYGPHDYLAPDLQGADALVVTDTAAAWATLPTLPATRNSFERRASFEVDRLGGLTGQVQVSVTGGYEQALRWRLARSSRQETVRELTDGLRGLVPDVTVDAAQVAWSEPANLRAAVDLRYPMVSERYADRTRTLLLLRPAVFERERVPAGLAGETRRTPVVLAAAPERTVNELSFRLPPELTVMEVPAEAARRERFGEFKVSFRLREGTLQYRREVLLLQPVIDAEQAAAARSWYEALAEVDAGWLVLKRAGE